jgi:hypothetical protein
VIGYVTPTKRAFLRGIPPKPCLFDDMMLVTKQQLAVCGG